MGFSSRRDQLLDDIQEVRFWVEGPHEEVPGLVYLPRDVAESFVNQTIRGAGHLLTDTTKSPAQLRYEVTSPGGTTAAAMHVLEERGFRALVEDAVRAAAIRSGELGAAQEGEAG